jgi:hypothetical protein
LAKAEQESPDKLNNTTPRIPLVGRFQQQIQAANNEENDSGYELSDQSDSESVTDSASVNDQPVGFDMSTFSPNKRKPSPVPTLRRGQSEPPLTSAAETKSKSTDNLKTRERIGDVLSNVSREKTLNTQGSTSTWMNA